MVRSALKYVVLPAALAAALFAAPSAAKDGKPAFVPVFEQNFPDAFVMTSGSEFIAYSTNDVQNVPMATSTDLIHWSFVRDAVGAKRDAMPTLAPWVKPGFTWAPEVIKIGGSYVLYYTANHRKQDKQCVGAAVADNPKGPFVDRKAEPLVCQFELGGTIDASPFRDKDGKHYLYFKADGNRIRKASRLFGAPLSADGLALAAPPTDLGIDDKDAWENHVVEAPTMIRTPDGLALLYSGGYFGWNGPERLSPYAMGYAMCASALGPCKEAKGNPVLYSYNSKEAGCLSGPGHQSVFKAAGGTFIAFHAWAATRGCRQATDKRYLYVAPFGWDNGRPVIASK